jgi:hypothetical protein
MADSDFRVLRSSVVFAQSEELPLAEEPVADPICKGATSWIELDGLYSELKSGRWVIVSGERADVTVDDPDHPGTPVAVPGIQSSELVMLANVVQDAALETGSPASVGGAGADPTGDGQKAAPLPGERNHTFLQFAKDLQYCYVRDKVTIYGNVVKATHGETRNETLGNGDGAKALQSFTLKQPPLTFVAALVALALSSVAEADGGSTAANPAIDMQGFLRMSSAAAEHRDARRLSEAEFLQMSRESGTIVLDARSREKYDQLHVAGAISLSFPDIAVESLRRAIPDPATRILIYCNNNFRNAEGPFPTKLPSASLNLSTYIALYTYGYRAIYELGPQLDLVRSILPFESTSGKAISGAGR